MQIGDLLGGLGQFGQPGQGLPVIEESGAWSYGRLRGAMGAKRTRPWASSRLRQTLAELRHNSPLRLRQSVRRQKSRSAS